MVNDFEKRYLALYYELQLQQWENYFEGGENDLTLIDGQIYGLVRSYSGIIEATDRKSEIAGLIIQRELVDRDPSVSICTKSY